MVEATVEGTETAGEELGKVVAANGVGAWEIRQEAR